MQLASLDFLLFFFPVMILVGLCLRGRYRSFACGIGGLVYCALQGISAVLPMLLAVIGVRLLLSMMSEPEFSAIFKRGDYKSQNRRRKHYSRRKRQNYVRKPVRYFLECKAYYRTKQRCRDFHRPVCF